MEVVLKIGMQKHHNTRRKQQDNIEIYVRCKELPKVDLFSKTDPFCVLHTKKYGEWFLVNKTEVIMNCHEPRFVETFVINKAELENNLIKLTIYDSQNNNTKDIKFCQRIASVIVKAECTEGLHEYPLLTEAKQTAGIIQICIMPYKASRKELLGTFGAAKLTKRGLFTRIDSFFEIEVELYTGIFHPIYRSEIKFKNHNPRWQTCSLSINKFRNEERAKIFNIKIYNFNAKGDHEPIGTLKLTLDELIRFQGTVKQFPLLKRTGSAKKKEKIESKTSSFLLHHIALENYYSLPDIVNTGIQFHCSIAVDFTLSNGNPNEITSLHYINDVGSNQYTSALQKCLSWIGSFCKSVDFYIFGGAVMKEAQAIYTETWEDIEKILNEGEEQLPNTSKCLYQHTSEYCVKVSSSIPIFRRDVSKFILDYRKILPFVRVSGPTYFAPVLAKIASSHGNMGNGKDFQVITVVTDGICNDSDELIQFFRDHKDHPLIALFIGIGPCNFRPLKYMVADINTKAHRNIAHFSRYKGHDQTQSDLMIVLKNICKDIVGFYKSSLHNVEDFDQYTDLYEPELDGQTCPTCGSDLVL